MVQQVAYDHYKIPAFLVNMGMSIVDSSIKKRIGVNIFKLAPSKNGEYCSAPAIFIAGKKDGLVTSTNVKEFCDKYNSKRENKVRKFYLESGGDHSAKREREILDSCYDFIKKEFTAYQSFVVDCSHSMQPRHGIRVSINNKKLRLRDQWLKYQAQKEEDKQARQRKRSKSRKKSVGTSRSRGPQRGRSQGKNLVPLAKPKQRKRSTQPKRPQGYKGIFRLNDPGPRVAYNKTEEQETKSTLSRGGKKKGKEVNRLTRNRVHSSQKKKKKAYGRLDNDARRALRADHMPENILSPHAIQGMDLEYNYEDINKMNQEMGINLMGSRGAGQRIQTTPDMLGANTNQLQPSGGYSLFDKTGSSSGEHYKTKIEDKQEALLDDTLIFDDDEILQGDFDTMHNGDMSIAMDLEELNKYLRGGGAYMSPRTSNVDGYDPRNDRESPNRANNFGKKKGPEVFSDNRVPGTQTVGARPGGIFGSAGPDLRHQPQPSQQNFNNQFNPFGSDLGPQGYHTQRLKPQPSEPPQDKPFGSSRNVKKSKNRLARQYSARHPMSNEGGMGGGYKTTRGLGTPLVSRHRGSGVAPPPPKGSNNFNKMGAYTNRGGYYNQTAYPGAAQRQHLTPGPAGGDLRGSNMSSVAVGNNRMSKNRSGHLSVGRQRFRQALRGQPKQQKAYGSPASGNDFYNFGG